MVVEADIARVGLKQAGQQFGRSRLAAAAGSDQRHDLARLDEHAEATQHGNAHGSVCELDAVDFNAGRAGNRQRLGDRILLNRHGQGVLEPTGGGEDRAGIEPANLRGLHNAKACQYQTHQRADVTGRQAPLREFKAAITKNHQGTDTPGERYSKVLCDPPRHELAESVGADTRRQRVEAGLGERLMAMVLKEADPAEVLVQVRR